MSLQNNIPKKALGQHFLKNESIARELVHAADVGPEDTVVEVGPGKGMITQVLLQHAKQVVAVEKDEQLADELERTFTNEVANKKLIVVPADILTFEPSHWKLKIGNWKLVGSIPYYITGQFLRRFLSIEPQPKTIALIIQKEVAERIIAKGGKPLDSARGKESILSISVKAYGTPRYIKTVKAGSFVPAPKVDSAIIAVEGISKDFFSDVSEEQFFSIVRKGFSNKRKKLVNNLGIKAKDGLFLLRQKRTVLCRPLPISPNARAENLSINDWKKIAKTL